ncbi:MAG: heme biosynthesis protein HemY [Rhodoferax sp.]
MRMALWLLGLFGVAVVLALFASNNPSTVTVFWPPYRVDLSLNLVLVLLGLIFAVLFLAIRALQALSSMPAQAQAWRQRHQERTLHQALVDALLHLVAGRFIRARKAAESVLARVRTLDSHEAESLDSHRIRTLAHLLVAESAQALRDRDARQSHFEQALGAATSTRGAGTREAVLLRAVRWSLEDRDPEAALRWLDQLPAGAARRTITLRLRLKVARLAGDPALALDTARLLAKHHAFSHDQANSLLRALATEQVLATRDLQQLHTTWERLEASERALPEVACMAAGRLLRLGGEPATALQWLLPVWERFQAETSTLEPDQEVLLMRVLENAFSSASTQVESVWLSRIDLAQRQRPGDAHLQYLAGVACLHLQLWGKAMQLIKQALPRLDDAGLQTRAWQVLAELAQRQGDTEQALLAWKNAAQRTLQRRAQS